MNAALLYRCGVPPAVAVTQGGIDGISGFIVQAAMLVMALATGIVSLDFAGLSSGGVNRALVPTIVVVLAVASVPAVWKVKRLHDRVEPVLRSVWRALADLVRSPSRALGLFGSQRPAP